MVPRTGWGNYWDADGHWSNYLYFNFNDDQLKLNANDANYANGNYGSVVAFPEASAQAPQPAANLLADVLEELLEINVAFLL